MAQLRSCHLPAIERAFAVHQQILKGKVSAAAQQSQNSIDCREGKFMLKAI
jgi:hypothetical protein